ncbi:MAG TPA: tRNA (adenosine(37)-N6)-threonylcarbamoyltransferase complex dimerization subunit type 1 TsaB [Gammaproteobacteria bacterium]|nr:tRNA (adenosine(37)-N6)-threonylcarbamoyltransferase complex dimerization subunit type 1 TsaB [Gammaproteobacteria bacterium]
MKLLALETSTDQCSVALLADGEVRERVQSAAHAHAELILPMVESLLAEAGLSLRQLDALAFGRGPGAFTGVRVATAVVQGLAFGAERPVVPVSDLMAVAAGAHRMHGARRVLACLDARLQEVYWCAYEVTAPDQLRECVAEQLGGADQVQPPAGRWFGAGSGFAVYRRQLQAGLGENLDGEDAALLPAACDVASLAAHLFAEGHAVSADAALPVYLRDQVATPKAL